MSGDPRRDESARTLDPLGGGTWIGLTEGEREARDEDGTATRAGARLR